MSAAAAASGARRIVLHVGPHKTGSTYLQSRLRDSRIALAAAGWAYPDFGMLHFAHHGICEWLMGTPGAPGEVNDASLRDMVARHEHVLLSSEDFVHLNAAQLARLRAALGDAHVAIVYFVRSAVDVWPSHWQELVRHGRDETLLEYLAVHAGWSPVFDPAVMNPIVQADKFARAFGRESLLLVCYDNIARAGGDLFRFFWSDVLGIAAPPPAGSTGIVHPSQPLHRVEMLRSLNERYRQRHGRAPGQRIHMAYWEQAAAIEASPAYDTFRQAFLANASEIRLSNSQTLISVTEHILLRQFGGHIVNKAAPNRIFLNEKCERTVRFCHRAWTDRQGLRGTIDAVLDGLAV